MNSQPVRSGVAISTTGDEHRMDLLVRCVQHWDAALGRGDSLFVTVDGDWEAVQRVAAAVSEWTGSVFHVGGSGEQRRGVAVSKNTGIELLMTVPTIRHLFLSDDDTWPLMRQSLRKHTDLVSLKHSMVCWGQGRLSSVGRHFATWSWPRGVMLYADRDVIERVGGMDERFGSGGHEHAEWSTRIFNAHLTPAPFCTPLSYGLRGERGQAMRAEALWHCEDMPRIGEKSGDHQARRKALTTLTREAADWERIHAVMADRQDSDGFVPYQAHANGRPSATLCQYTPSQGADT